MSARLKFHRRIFLVLCCSTIVEFFSGVQMLQAIPRLCLSAMAELGAGGGEAAVRKIETLDDLLHSFSEGMLPDLSRREHRAAFDVYLKMRFGQETQYVTPATVDKEAAFLQAHPELVKAPLHPVRVDLVQKDYPVTEKLQSFILKQKKFASQSLAIFFQLEANLGDWKKILHLEDAHEIPKDAPKEERKRLQEENRKALLTRIKEMFGAAEWDQAQKLPPRDRAVWIFKALFRIRTEFRRANQDIRPISQAMVDLVHSVSFQENNIPRILKEGNGLERITALRRAITDRDNLAYLVGFQGHFRELLEALEVDRPTGQKSKDSFEKELSDLESEVLQKAILKPGEGTTRWVRPLSLAEAPLRSRLGLCCSSDTWLTTALHPNYQFYTWTDETGASTGQISLTLGTATSSAAVPETSARGFFRRVKKEANEPQKVAFVNKIQNIPPEELPAFLEGVRLSLAEDGYLLDLPEDLGENLPGHGGISNSTDTIRAVKLIPRSEDVLQGFRPHPFKTGISFDQNDYDRSNLGLSGRAILPLKGAEGLQFSVEPKQKPQILSADIRLQDFVEATYRLKDSPSLEDKMRYIPSMQALEKAGLKVDVQFDQTLDQWLNGPQENFKLRKQALIYLWQRGGDLSRLLASFPTSDRTTLLQNILDTPRYKKVLLEKRGQIPDLAVSVRSSKKVRSSLLSEWVKGDRGIFETILDADDIPHSEAVNLLMAIKRNASSNDLTSFIYLLKLVAKTSIREKFSVELKVKFLENVGHPVQLSRALTAALESESPEVRNFALELLDSQDPRLEELSILRIFKELRNRMQASGETFGQASARWMRDSKVEPALKTEFLLGQDSPWSSDFEKLEASVPDIQRAEVDRRLDQKSTVRVYRALAQQSGIHSSDLAKASMEAYLLVDSGITPEKSVTFMMGSPEGEDGRYANEARKQVTLTKPISEGATEVTQLQYYLVKKQNPSKFVGDGEDTTITIKGIRIDVNRPVEKVSQEESIAYSEELNQFENKMGIGTGTSRLPTEAEWEYLARNGTTTAFFFGDDRADLDEYGWTYQNSENRTHRVATKRPDSKGSFDHHGNVWEWTLDTYKENLEGGTDPQVTEPGSDRVIRGGSWGFVAQLARSAFRNYVGPGVRFDVLGFRLVRTPKVLP